MRSILDLVQGDVTLKKTSSHRGGEWHGPCPFCGGVDRLRVQPDRDFWTCRQCGRGGDAVAYLVESGRITKAEAARIRHGDEAMPCPTAGRRPTTPQPDLVEPPGAAWQERAWVHVNAAKKALWDARGRPWRVRLQQRGLTDATIEAAGLGYNPRDTYELPEAWGLPRDHKKVWLPQGIVIPWVINGNLWRVNVRRPAGDPKYCGPAGSSNGLYNAGGLRPDKPAVIAEGEFDALSINQVAGDIVTAVATGSVAGSRKVLWEVLLSMCPSVLIAYDADDAGDKSWSYWRDVLPNARRWRPVYGDVNAMLAGGFDLRAWVIAGLGGEPEPVRTCAETQPAQVAECRVVTYDGRPATPDMIKVVASLVAMNNKYAGGPTVAEFLAGLQINVTEIDVSGWAPGDTTPPGWARYGRL